jgi:hypothetical protein
VEVDTTIASFEQSARNFDTNYKILKFLNPWLRKPFLTNNDGRKYVIRIPGKDVRTSAAF